MKQLLILSLILFTHILYTMEEHKPATIADVRAEVQKTIQLYNDNKTILPPYLQIMINSLQSSAKKDSTYEKRDLDGMLANTKAIHADILSMLEQNNPKS